MLFFHPPHSLNIAVTIFISILIFVSYAEKVVDLVLKTNDQSMPKQSCNLPPIAVWRVDISTKLNEELDDVVVTSADGVVQRCDAFVIGVTDIVHLKDNVKTFYLINPQS